MRALGRQAWSVYRATQACPTECLGFIPRAVRARLRARVVQHPAIHATAVIHEQGIILRSDRPRELCCALRRAICNTSSRGASGTAPPKQCNPSGTGHAIRFGGVRGARCARPRSNIAELILRGLHDTEVESVEACLVSHRRLRRRSRNADVVIRLALLHTDGSTAAQDAVEGVEASRPQLQDWLAHAAGITLDVLKQVLEWGGDGPMSGVFRVEVEYRFAALASHEASTTIAVAVTEDWRHAL
mmetsp:Transcript_162714/g.516987  ORF Transcript_162714/g.516987 Transcript_162714/m.516987 type:complete len:244 (-) Transcript_162714:422-1153(-)